MVKPLGDNVLVELFEKEKQTAQGIYLPDNAQKESSQEGKVIAIGQDEKIEVKKGQKVIFRKFSGSELKISGKNYLILKNEDILAVIG